MSNKKAIAYMIVGLMFLSAFVVVADHSSATVINPNNSYDLEIRYTDLDDTVRHRAENITFWITMYNGGSTTLTNCNLSVNTTIRDMDGNVVNSPLTWTNQDVNDNVTLSRFGGSHTFSGFGAIIKPDAKYGVYNVTVYMTFKDGGTSHGYEGYILFEIGPRAQVYYYGSTPNMWPGEVGHELRPGLVLSETLHNVYWNISVPDSDFQFQGDSPSSTGVYESDVSSGYVWFERFLVDVSKDKAPGVYTFPMTLEYLISGQMIQDELILNVTVKRLGTIEVSSDVSQIDRGVSTMNITFYFTNTGNVDLTNLKVRLDDAEDYFSIPKEVIRYEGDRPIYRDEWVNVGNVSAGETASKVIKIIIDSHLPAGKHKVLFDFKAEYENGTVHSAWRWESSPDNGSSAHYMPEWWGTYMGSSWGYYPDDSRTQHIGAYVMLDVVGDVFDMKITPSWGVSSSVASLIKDETTISLRVQNNEARSYRDLSFFVFTGPSSPFVNVDDPGAQWSEPFNVSRLYGGSSTTISLHVKMRSGMLAGYYDVPIKVTATDLAGGNTVENEVTTRMLITGSGAKPVITSVSTGEVSPGKTFAVRVTIENTGDDVAKNLMVKLAVQNSLEGSDIALVSGPPKVDELNPGESTTLEFTFVASSDLERSQTYPIDAEISYDNMFKGDSDVETQQIGIQSSSKGVNTSDIMTWLLIVLIVLAIIGSILLIVKSVRSGKHETAPAQTVESAEPAPSVEPEPVEPVEAPEEPVEPASEPPEEGGETEF